MARLPSLVTPERPYPNRRCEGRWPGRRRERRHPLFANGVKTIGLWEDHQCEEGQRS